MPDASAIDRPATTLSRYCFLLIILLFGNSVRAADAPERVALVIGNGAYMELPLMFAGNDATAMGEALRNAGFAVTRAQDLNTTDMRKAIDSFIQQTQSAKVVLFYYAGHGIQTSTSSRARNFLLPIDISPNADESAIQNGIDVQQELIERLGSNIASRIVVVILDACRLPARSAARSTNTPLASNSIGGMARMEISSGTFLAYAAQPNTRAVEDPASSHGLYTNSLLKELTTPGLTLEQVFKRTRSAVEAASNNKQSPREESALRGDQELRIVETRRPAALYPISVVSSSPRSNATGPRPVAGVAGLLASIRNVPRERRLRALTRLLQARTFTWTAHDLEEILGSFWVAARPHVLSVLEPQMPRTFAPGEVTSFLSLLDRYDLNEMVRENELGRRLAAQSDPLSGSLNKNVCRVAEQPGLAAAAAPASEANVDLLLKKIGTDPAVVTHAIHDLLQQNDFQLSFADASRMLQAMPGTTRAHILSELIVALPDRLAPDQMLALVKLASEQDKTDVELFLALAWRLDQPIPMPQARAIVQAFSGPIAVPEFWTFRLNKFCPDVESAVTFLNHLQLTHTEYLYMLRGGRYWELLNAPDRLSFVAHRPPGDRVTTLHDVFQAHPSVPLRIEDIAKALGGSGSSSTEIRSALGIGIRVGGVIQPLNDHEKQIVKTWLPPNDRHLKTLLQ